MFPDRQVAADESRMDTPTPAPAAAPAPVDNQGGFWMVAAAHSRGCACPDDAQHAERRVWVDHDFNRILNAGNPS